MKWTDKRQKDRKKMAVGGDGFEGYGDEAELLSQQRPSFPDTESSTLLWCDVADDDEGTGESVATQHVHF